MKKDKDSFCKKKVFLKRMEKKIVNSISDIVSDMDLTSLLGTKEALSYINNVLKNFVTSRLHSGMCKKNKLRVHSELKEDFECKKYLQECLTWVLAFVQI